MAARICPERPRKWSYRPDWCNKWLWFSNGEANTLFMIKASCKLSNWRKLHISLQYCHFEPIMLSSPDNPSLSFDHVFDTQISLITIQEVDKIIRQVSRYMILKTMPLTRTQESTKAPRPYRDLLWTRAPFGNWQKWQAVDLHVNPCHEHSKGKEIGDKSPRSARFWSNLLVQPINKYFIGKGYLSK